MVQIDSSKNIETAAANLSSPLDKFMGYFSWIPYLPQSSTGGIWNLNGIVEILSA